MEPSRFESPNWLRALTLTERLRLLRAAPGGTRPPAEFDAATAEQAVREWQSQNPFHTSLWFARRLALDGTDEEEFRRVLGEPAAAFRERSSRPPAWLHQLAEAFSRPPASGGGTVIPESLRNQPPVFFLTLVEPLITSSRERLRDGMRALSLARTPALFDAAALEEALFADAAVQLVRLMSRTLVLELHVARLRGQLEGGTPAERFESFTRRLRLRDFALDILEEYPVLARQLVTCLEHWVGFSLEFLTHLQSDWEAIRNTFLGGSDPGALVGVGGALGDTHQRGRSVLRARFASGFDLIYKPRPMSVDTHFQILLRWLNERGDHPPFRTLKILDRGGHGWAEYVTPGGCSRAEEVRRFYERQGGYLALLYALEATDFHYENVIAAGEHPVLVDLESLFHPRVERAPSERPDLSLVRKVLSRSVLRVGLLPSRVGARGEYEGMDISGLGAAEGQLAPERLPQWEQMGTDEMRVVRRQTTLPGGDNRATLDGAAVDLPEHVEAITDGFANVYRLIQTRRDELLSADGPIARFAGDKVRAIIRPTRVYSVLLHESFHPDLLRDALERDRFFDKLWVGVEESPHLLRVIPEERADLLRADIPKFVTRPETRSVLSSSRKLIPDFFDDTGMSLVERRVRQMCEADLTRQLWFVRASVATVSLKSDRFEYPSYRPAEPRQNLSPPRLRERLLAAARDVGDRLEALALADGSDVTWVGLAFDKKRWSLIPLEEDLYAGTPGVILFLAYLGAVSGEGRYTRLARTALTTLRRRLKHTAASVTMIGAFQGWGGIIYTLSHLGALWGEQELFAEAEEFVKLLPPLIEQDEILDVIGGCAGCIGGLLSLYTCAPSERTLAAAMQCGERLLARAQPMERGVGWLTQISAARPQTGFSHGASGIGWALAELAALAGDGRYKQAALEAVVYEHSRFSPEEGNWLDAGDHSPERQSGGGGEQALRVAWCYGAPGVGLARLRMLRLLDEPLVRAELEAALRVTLAKGFGHNHSLCHGDLGNLELLIQADELLDGPRLREHIDHTAAIILDSIARHGRLCGIPLRADPPGLMNGLAGIGYGLLRLAEPAYVPPVLTLARPRRCTESLKAES